MSIYAGRSPARCSSSSSPRSPSPTHARPGPASRRGPRWPRTPWRAPGPQQLRTVPADAFPPHQGFGDARFGVVQASDAAGEADQVHAGFERVQIPWNYLQPTGPDQWNSMVMLQDRPIDHELAHGRHLFGVLLGVPGWAAQHPSLGGASVPKGIDLPWNDPKNYWGQFVYHAVRHYAGRIDTFAVLNEVNIAGGRYHQFAGTPAQYAQMLRVAYLAAHAANPRVAVHIYGDNAYEDYGRWFGQTLDALAAFPRARDNNLFFDAAELHLYDSLLLWPRIFFIWHNIMFIWHNIMRAHGIDKPIWVTETNVSAREDTVRHVVASDDNAPPAVQSAFIVQGFAAALGLGAPRVEIYKMRDSAGANAELLGLTRADGSVRAVATAFATANRWFAGVTAARYDPGSQSPNPSSPSNALGDAHQPLYRVTMERPGQEIQVLWDHSTRSIAATVPALGNSALVVQPNGTQRTVHASGGAFHLRLDAATDRSHAHPGGFDIGGAPLIVVQDLPGRQHVPGLHPLYVERNRGVGAADTLGPVTSIATSPAFPTVRVVADTVHDRVLIEDVSGRVTARVGTTGGAPGRFRGPAGAAVGPDGTFYVADEGNARVQEFDLFGRLLGGFGTYDGGGNQAAALRAPSAVAVAPDNTLYVADTLNNRVQEFDRAGAYLAQIGGGGLTLRWPTGVAVTSDGRVAIADAGDGRVVLSANPKTFLDSTPLAAGIAGPGGLAIAPDGSYWVADTRHNRVVQLDATGHQLAAYGSAGHGRGQFEGPLGLAFGPDGNLYVTDAGNNRIQALTPAGHVVGVIGSQGKGPGQFLGPHGVSVDRDGTVWVADTFNNRVQHLRFNARDGTSRVIDASVATGINGVWGVAADGQGGVYYSGRYAQRVYHRHKDGSTVVLGGPGIGSGEFMHPGLLAAAPGMSAVYVGDEDNKRVQVIVGDRIAGQRGNGSTGASGLGDPAAVAVAHDGSLAVLDAARLRIVRYQGAGAGASTSLTTPGAPGVPLSLAADGRGLVVAIVDPLRGTSRQQRLTVR